MEQHQPRKCNKRTRFFIITQTIMLFMVLSLLPVNGKKQTNTIEAKVVQQTDKKVRGQVKDTQGEPMIGVTVKVKGTETGAITNLNGEYEITASTGSTLIFSFIGCKTQELIVPAGTVLNVVMSDDAQALEEVVVIGYGTARRKDLTGAISTIRAEELKAEIPRNMHDLMRSNAAGLNIEMNSSAKGGGDFLIRGKGTLKAGSQPLIVLDGVIYNGEFSDLNPQDVLSIDVLKDASSLAVYGAKAANGVIAINTIKGNKGGKPTINVSATWGLVELARRRKILDANGFLNFRQDYVTGNATEEYLQTYPEIFTNPARLQNVDKLVWYNYDMKNPVTSATDDELTEKWLSRLYLTSPEINNYMNGNITKWDDLLFHTGVQQDYNVSISNSNDKGSYYWSLGYTDKESIYVGDGFKRFSSHLNLESHINDFITVGLNMNFSSRDESDIVTDWKSITLLSPYASNDIGIADSPNQRLPTGDASVINPFYDRMFKDKKNIINTLTGTMYGRLKLPFGISYQFNFTPYSQWKEDFLHESAKNEAWAGTGGKSTRRHDKVWDWQVDNVFNWKKVFAAKHAIDLTFLINAEKSQSWRTDSKNQNYAPNDYLGWHLIDNGKTPSVLSRDYVSTGDALMGRAFYSYNNKYMLTASVRRDGYSAFGKRNPRATFPAFAAGWVFTSEKFAEGIQSWFNYGKLRLSWGSNGNRDIGAMAAMAELVAAVTPYIDSNGNVYQEGYTFVQKMANWDLKWEQTYSYNIGLDFALFNELISGAMELYSKQTTDLLVDRALPPLTGFSNVTSNLGQLNNTGFELTLNANILKRHNFEWSASGNFSLNRRKIVKLYGTMENIVDEGGNIIGQKEADDITNGWFIGQDPDRLWGYIQDGVWQLDEAEEAKKYGNLPGDFKYLDLNEDGVMNNKDKRHQKYTTPRFRWMLRNNFRLFNDFDLSFMFYSLWGHYGTFNDAANNNTYPERSSNYDQPRWTPTNPINDYARIGSKNLGSNWVEKSFIRLDNITLSYNVPRKLLKKIKVENMRFTGSVRNVAVFAPHWKNWDPETSNPYGRTFSFGINFTM